MKSLPFSGKGGFANHNGLLRIVGTPQSSKETCTPSTVQYRVSQHEEATAAKF